MPRPDPPRKKAGDASGRRLHSGEVNVRLLDIATLAAQLGCSEDEIRGRVARGLLPHRRWSGRIVFLANDVEQFFSKLPGVSVTDALANVEQRQSQEGAA